MSIICNRCGTEFNSPYCLNCGAPTQVQMQQNQPQQFPPPIQPQYQQGSYRQPMQPPKKKSHGCLITFLVVIGIFIFIGVIGILASFGDYSNTFPYPQ